MKPTKEQTIINALIENAEWNARFETTNQWRRLECQTAVVANLITETEMNYRRVCEIAGVDPKLAPGY